MRRFLITVLVTASPLALTAQGSLSMQGFGYPVGQGSSRAEGTAGVLSETDPGSPVNPCRGSTPDTMAPEAYHSGVDVTTGSKR